jgi:hypothetical protein
MKAHGLVPLGVAVLSFVCFLPALSGTFLNWDDNFNFLENLDFQGPLRGAIHWALTSVMFGHYIPVTRLTWVANRALGGLNPWGYHLANLLVHAANAVMLYVVACRLLAAAGAAGDQTERRRGDVVAGAAAAALVFGMHPLRVEPVSWITGRADLLCTLFALLATWAYLRSVERDGPARPGWLLASAAALALALLSKGGALPLPVAFLLLDIYPLRRTRRLGWRRILMEKVPLLVVAFVGAVVILQAVRAGAVLTQMANVGPVARVTAAAYSFTLSLLRFVWPVSLSPLHEMPERIHLTDDPFALAVAAAMGITIGLAALWRRWPGGLVAWIFSALMLVPTNLALRQGADLAPDRYSYLAGLGYAVVVGGGALAAIHLTQRERVTGAITWMMGVCAVAAMAALGLASWSFSEVWTQSESLWRWAVDLDPTCSVCHGKLGESVLTGPDGITHVAEAEGLFRRAIALRPDLPDAYYNLGTALVLQGRFREAEAPLREYMTRVPEAGSGPERLGLVYLVEGRHAEAVPLLRSALARKADSAALRGHLIQALEGASRQLRAEGRLDESDRLLAEARTLGASAERPPASPTFSSPSRPGKPTRP